MDRPPAVTPSTKVSVAAEVLASDFGAEYVLLNLKNGMYYGLDNVGAELWRRIQHAATVQAICGELLGEFEVDEETCRRDVIRLIAELVDHGLVEIDNP